MSSPHPTPCASGCYARARRLCRKKSQVQKLEESDSHLRITERKKNGGSIFWLEEGKAEGKSTSTFVSSTFLLSLASNHSSTSADSAPVSARHPRSDPLLSTLNIGRTNQLTSSPPSESEKLPRSALPSRASFPPPCEAHQSTIADPFQHYLLVQIQTGRLIHGLA